MARAKFLYLRIPNSNSLKKIVKVDGRIHRGDPFGCIASRYEGDVLYYSVSTVNPRDNFDKTLAREIALGRLVTFHASGAHRYEVPDARKTNKNIQTTFDLMTHIKSNKKLPTDARKAAAAWCKEYISQHAADNK